MDKRTIMLSGFSLLLVSGSFLFIAGFPALADIAATLAWALLTAAIIFSVLGNTARKGGRRG
ncbi:MAG TPA: hypothetical protein VLD37_06625 [Candidatus Bilamarchaeum sp.]|nr:hypothetical protein [Candidatus Bilamarchaeum sp.]